MQTLRLSQAGAFNVIKTEQVTEVTFFVFDEGTVIEDAICHGGHEDPPLSVYSCRNERPWKLL